MSPKWPLEAVIRLTSGTAHREITMPITPIIGALPAKPGTPARARQVITSELPAPNSIPAQAPSLVVLV